MPAEGTVGDLHSPWLPAAVCLPFSVLHGGCYPSQWTAAPPCVQGWCSWPLSWPCGKAGRERKGEKEKGERHGFRLVGACKVISLSQLFFQ